MDCLEGIKSIQAETVDCVCADPPYFLGMTTNGQKGTFTDLNICKPFFAELAQEIKRVLKDTGAFYFFTDWRGYAFYYPILSEALPVRNMIVWDKGSGPGNFYSFAHELIIFGNMAAQNMHGQNVWREKSFCNGAKKTNGEKVHPTQKPIELIERIVTDGSPEGGLVLDPFSGSGTTAAACIRTGRHFVGFEIDDGHYARSMDRIRKEGEGHGNGAVRPV